MELASGHTVHLQPENSAPAVVLRLPQALRQALAAAQQNGERVALRCSQNGNRFQATLSVGILQHEFVGVPVEKQIILRLSTLDDVDGAVVANIGCKLHQQKALHTSDIGSRIRASAQAEKQGRGQTQVLDRVPPSNGHSKAYRSLTPPAATQRPAAVQQRPKTPPPNLEKSNAAAPAAAAGSSRSQAQAARLAGRSLTPPSSRPSTPPPAKQQQQQQTAGNAQQQQQPRPQNKPVAKDPPKPRSLAGSKQQQRRTPPPANLQQQGQRPTAAGNKVGASTTAPLTAVEVGGPTSHNNASTFTTSAAVPRISPAPSATPTMPGVPSAAGGSSVQGKASSARPTAPGASAAVGTEKAAVQRSTAGGGRPGSRGVSPAVGSSAAIAAKQQHMRSAMPLISVQPLPQAPRPAGDRRSPAPSTGTTQQQQQQQPPQRSRLQQGSNANRPTSTAAANPGNGSKPQQSAGNGSKLQQSAGNGSKLQQSAGNGSKLQQSAGLVAVTRPASTPGQQQQQQVRKRPAPGNEVAGNTSGAASKAAKMRRLNELGAPKGPGPLPAAVGAGGTTSQPGVRKPAAKQQQQQAARQVQLQPLRRGASPSLPAVGGHRLSPDGSHSSAGASPSQQQQHTKHWFTSSDESGEVCSVGDEPVGKGRAAPAAPASNKRKRDLDSVAGSLQPSVTAATPATHTSTAQQSWAAAIQAKKTKQHVNKSAMVEPAAAGRPKTAVDPAAAKSSWQAALRRHSPPDQAIPTNAPGQQQQQQQPSVPMPAAVGSHKPLRAPAAAAPAAAKTAQPLDLGPPGYRVFVDRGPRSFGPIGSQEEYLQYTAMYEAQYPMYLTLSNIIDTNIRYVREAHAKMAAETIGSSAYLEAKQRLQHQLTSKGELTRRWNTALATLHTELCALKARMQQWVQCRRAVASTAAATAAGKLPTAEDTTWNTAQDVQDVQQQKRQCLGGKGFMLAGMHGVQHAAVVGA